jgi:hypothetical protein
MARISEISRCGVIWLWHCWRQAPTPQEFMRNPGIFARGRLAGFKVPEKLVMRQVRLAGAESSCLLKNSRRLHGTIKTGLPRCPTASCS